MESRSNWQCGDVMVSDKQNAKIKVKLWDDKANLVNIRPTKDGKWKFIKQRGQGTPSISACQCRKLQVDTAMPSKATTAMGA